LCVVIGTVGIKLEVLFRQFIQAVDIGGISSVFMLSASPLPISGPRRAADPEK